MPRISSWREIFHTSMQFLPLSRRMERGEGVRPCSHFLPPCWKTQKRLLRKMSHGISRERSQCKKRFHDQIIFRLCAMPLVPARIVVFSKEMFLVPFVARLDRRFKQALRPCAHIFSPERKACFAELRSVPSEREKDHLRSRLQAEAACVR